MVATPSLTQWQSSGHTGEHAIHSSDFSAFTKRSHCPSLLRFLTPTYLFAIIHLHFGDCLSGTCSPRGEVAMEFRRCQPPCARFPPSLLPFFPGAHRAPPRPLVRSRPLVKPRPGVRMSSSRRWRVSRQASPFLSLPLPGACMRIRRSNSTWLSVS